MTYQPGECGNPKGAPKKATRRKSPVTASYCRTHYKQLCDLAEKEDWDLFEPRDLITLFKFEHDSLYGRAPESVSVQHSGEITQRQSVPLITEMTAEQWLQQFAPSQTPIQ
jgi:hypothetical protein